MRRLLLLAIALGASGCFPDYSSSGTDEQPLEPGMKRVRSRNKPFEFSVGNYQYGSPPDPPTIQNPVPASVEFSHDFDMDQHEVTVGRYQAWINAGYPLPCADKEAPCGIDSDGPYDDEIIWQPEWNPEVLLESYGPSACFGSPPGNYGNTTFALGDVDLPMTCVSWFQAVAFCAWEGKRLPTESEWLFVASSNGTKYPWGDSWSGCDEATITYPNCPFPVAIGTGAGHSAEGVEDLGGSVVEWVWDASWTDTTEDWPNAALDYTGPEFSTGQTEPHLRNGGFYWSPQESEQLKNTAFEADFTADNRFDDQGFRCVRTVPHD